MSNPFAPRPLRAQPDRPSHVGNIHTGALQLALRSPQRRSLHPAIEDTDQDRIVPGA